MTTPQELQEMQSPQLPPDHADQIELTDLEEKYRIGDDRFVFKALYSPEHNVIINHSEDKQTGDIYRSENLGSLGGIVKFDAATIDEYIGQAIGAAFPVYDNTLGFIMSYDDLFARKYMLSEAEFSAITTAYPRLDRRLQSVTDTIRLVSKTRVDVNFATGQQTTTVFLDNTAANWWSSMSVPEYKTAGVLTTDELIALQSSLESIVYSDPIERHIWKQIKENTAIEQIAEIILDDQLHSR